MAARKGETIMTTLTKDDIADLEYVAKQYLKNVRHSNIDDRQIDTAELSDLVRKLTEMRREASEPQNECDDCGTAISQHDDYCDDCGKANHEAQYGDMDNHYDDSVWY